MTIFFKELKTLKIVSIFRLRNEYAVLIPMIFTFTTINIEIINLNIFLLEKAVGMAALAQLGERQTEDLKAPCSIHGGGISFSLINNYLSCVIICFLP